MYVCFDRYEFDRLFYHFARKEQEKKILGSLGIRHLDDKCCTKSNQDKMHNFLHQNFHGERRKVVVLGSGWGALSFVRKLDPSAFDATWKPDKLHQITRGYAWLRVVR